MGQGRALGSEVETAVAVSDAAVSPAGWCSVQPKAADPFRGARPGGCLQDPAAIPMPTDSDSPAPDTAPRIPLDAFVSVGRKAIRSARSVSPRGPARSANDNRRAGEAGASRSVWRDVILLVLLAATVAGAFWSGRLHASYKVIVVPAPTMPHSVVT